MILGNYLREAREAKGLTQIEVAKRLGYSTSQFVSNWERGMCSPAENKMKKLIKMLGLDKNALKVKWTSFQIIQIRKKADRLFK